MTREEFLQRFSMFFFGAVGATGVLSSCSSEKQAETETPAAQPEVKMAVEDPCNDLTGLTDVEITVRKTFEYVGSTPIPEQRCDNCQFWTVPEAGATCGGCQIMKGPFNPKGYCKQWTVKIA